MYKTSQFMSKRALLDNDNDNVFILHNHDYNNINNNILI